jgi:morphogenetic protein associated with SpoVID
MKIHVIRPGDCISDLAQRYNIPVPRLLEVNPQIKDAQKLEVNEKVRVPTGRILLPSSPQMETPAAVPEQSVVLPENGGDFTAVELNPAAGTDVVEELADELTEYASPYFSMFVDSCEYDESTQYPPFNYMDGLESSTWFESTLQGMNEENELPVPPALWYPYPYPYPSVPQGDLSYLPFPPLFGPIGWIASSSPSFAGAVGWPAAVAPPSWAGQFPYGMESYDGWERESSSREG